MRECVCETCARKDCNERTKQDDLRIVIQCYDFVKKNMTNGDRVRAMSDEELASTMEDCIKCDGCPVVLGCSIVDVNCYERMLNWLKQPVEGE